MGGAAITSAGNVYLSPSANDPAGWASLSDSADGGHSSLVVNDLLMIVSLSISAGNKM